jgi:hypothetical protein
LYLLEAVTSLGPFTGQRIETLIEDFHTTMSGGEKEFEAVFITMFPDSSRYREYLMDIGAQSHIWLSNHPDDLITRGNIRLDVDEPKETDVLYTHLIS